MSTRPFVTGLAVLLTFSFIVPTTFFIAPQRAYGADAVFITGSSAKSDLITAAKTSIVAIQSTLTQVSAATSAWAANADWVLNYILKPIAFIQSGQMMRMMTASIVGFVIGKANGTGVPQFVVDVQRSMQGVSDGAALAYLQQIGNTNSPFSGSIKSALATDYLTKSSLEGFWKRNMCTLAATSPDVPAYLAGNWSQGGIEGWFTLTTQTQNNPYSLYLHTQEQLANVIGPGVPNGGGVTGARATELGWGQGFLSWCGPAESDAATGSMLQDNFGAGAPGSSVQVGINPGDPCQKSDGTLGSIKTPGSVISATLNKVLGGQQDQIIRMGDVSGQINGILGNIGKVFSTINFASQLLGGGDSGGLISAGASSPSGASAALEQLQSASTFGITEPGIVQSLNATTLDPSVSGAAAQERVNQYQAAWGAIGAAANTASTSVATLAQVCTTNAGIAQAELEQLAEQPETTGTTAEELQAFIKASTAQASAAKIALETTIAPVIAQAAKNTSPNLFAPTIAMIQKVQNDLSAGDSAYVADLQTLSTMPPTQTDVANAQTMAQAFGGEQTDGSLSVSLSTTYDSVIDQMNLISANAKALKTSVCTYKPFGFFGY